MKTRAVNDSSVFCSRDESTNGANWATRQSRVSRHSTGILDRLNGSKTGQELVNGAMPWPLHTLLD